MKDEGLYVGLDEGWRLKDELYVGFGWQDEGVCCTLDDRMKVYVGLDEGWSFKDELYVGLDEGWSFKDELYVGSDEGWNFKDELYVGTRMTGWRCMLHFGWQDEGVCRLWMKDEAFWMKDEILRMKDEAFRNEGWRILDIDNDKTYRKRPVPVP